MNHKYYEKELLNDYIECDLKNVTHLVERKDILIETTQVNDSLKRRTRSEKVRKLAAHTLNFSAPIGLSFEHTRAAGS